MRQTEEIWVDCEGGVVVVFVIVLVWIIVVVVVPYVGLLWPCREAPNFLHGLAGVAASSPEESLVSVRARASELAFVNGLRSCRSMSSSVRGSASFGVEEVDFLEENMDLILFVHRCSVGKTGASGST